MDDQAGKVEEETRQDGADVARRRLLKTAAYAAPFVLTFGLPRTGSAGSGASPNDKRKGAKGRGPKGGHGKDPD